ncbi:MAG TPA: kelch repeat-containing protein [Pyrinomonadaceae bacterium]|nr:kelch repeat-containing protein [Pyrinomonadaceae bacterium]
MKNTTRRTLLAILVLTLVTRVSGCTVDGVVAEKPAGAEIGAVVRVGSMTTSRAAHTATLLPDGRVFVAGGLAGGSGTATTEIFDPAKSTFASASDMSVARTGHTATLLSNGKVLIAGGYNGSYLANAELYDPAANSFTPVRSMNAARSGHVATVLPNGKVLLVGGVGVGWTFLSSAEVFDPATNTFTSTGDMLAARESHTATLLGNGKVLIAGGHRGRRPSVTIYSSTEIYDPATGRFTAGSDMTRIRHKHEAVLLADGRVLIAGGSDERDGDGAYANAEIYDPVSSTFRATGNMNSARYKLQGTGVLLSDGKVLVAGGANRAEVFDPARNTFTYAGGNMETPRLFATATRLRNGQVLIIGGYHSNSIASFNAWLYRT